jgi:secondary thiamine-phosphate synthase enzyme
MTAMRAHIKVQTRGRESLEDITSEVREVVRRSGLVQGLCYLFVPHTTAGIIINENADPSVCQDILERLAALVPRNGRYHHLEGNADAHIKSSLVGQGAWVPVEGADLALGRWQGIFLAEFDGPRERTVIVTLIPTPGGAP